MTPQDRARLIARAKALAVPVVSCVAARLRPDHLRRGLTEDEAWALIVVLAECADMGRLRAVTSAPGDEGMPRQGDREVLRAVHAERARLERAGLPVPYAVLAADGRYRADVRRRRTGAARENRGEDGEAA